MRKSALYYPYIRIQDIDWLKANLLIFSQVSRMLPNNFDPFDSDEVKRYATWTPRGASPACPCESMEPESN